MDTVCAKRDLSAPPRGFISCWSGTEMGLINLGTQTRPIIEWLLTLQLSNWHDIPVMEPTKSGKDECSADKKHNNSMIPISKKLSNVLNALDMLWLSASKRDALRYYGLKGNSGVCGKVTIFGEECQPTTTIDEAPTDSSFDVEVKLVGGLHLQAASHKTVPPKYEDV